MVEPYLLAANGNSTTPQASQLWQNEYPFSTTTANHNTKHQLLESDDDDGDVQFVGEVIPVSSRPTNTVDLSQSIFDVGKDEFDVYLNGTTHSINATHATYIPHTITTGQTSPQPVFDFALENSRLDDGIALPHPIPQTLPQINVNNFAKENVIASNDNGAKASNNLLGSSLYDAADWVEDPDVINHVFGNARTEQLPKTIVPTATTTSGDVKWENIFGVMEQNQPGPSGITAHHPRQVFSNVGGSSEYGRRIIEPSTSNSTWVTPNGTPIGKIDQQNQPGPNAAKFNWPLPPQTKEVDATSIFEQNQPGPKGIHPGQPIDLEVNRRLLTLNDLQNQPGPSGRTLRRVIDMGEYHRLLTQNYQQNQPGPSGITLQQIIDSGGSRRLLTPNGQINQSGPNGIPPRQIIDLGGNRQLLTPNYQQNQLGPNGIPPRQIIDMGGYMRPNGIHPRHPIDLGGNRQLLTPNDQQNQPGPSAAQPNWIEPLLPQMNKVNVNAINIYQQNHLESGGTTHQPGKILTNQGEHGPKITPHIFNGTLVFTNNTPIGKSIKRKHTATIPIKIIRNTKQYETLVEMGFPKKDIEIALRKCNLDLNETIEYLSEPKREEKKRRINLNDLNPFDHDYLIAIQQSLQEPNNEQSHEQHKVGTEPDKKPANLYEELLQLEETGGIVKSFESFDCEICMDTIEMKDGMILRNCLHRYCKDCLNGTIVHSDEVSIKCPYVSCEEMVQDREIRAVLSQDEYEKFLMKGVRVAQVTISGTILCNFPDCDGWCICEDVVNEFKCPQCKNINCIPCKAIHPERNCKEYQDDLAAGDANGVISGQRRSEQAIQDLINRNEAMKCFNCGILIMKRDGCDYIQCAMCKAGICWATRGPRYGPGGVGDLSGGCQCSVRKRCHKDCRGCH